MAKISELSDGGSLQSTDFLIAVRSGGNVKVQADGNLSLGTVTADGLTVDSGSTNTQLTLARSTTHSGISFSTQISDFGGGGADLIFDGSGNSTGFGFRPTNSSGTLQTGLVISPDGNVGINTASPDRAIKIEKDNAYVWIADAAGGNVGFIGGSGSNDGLMRLYEGTGHTAKVEIHSNADSYFNGGNVGIGTASPSNTLEVASDSQNSGITIYNDFTSGGRNARIGFKSLNSYDASSVLAAITATPTSSANTSTSLVFQTSGDNNLASAGLTEAMRIDVSGNLLVGTTVTPNTLISASATQGVAFNGSSGYLVAAASGQAAAYFNRQTSDGDLIDFRKDGTTVGSIATNSSRFELDGSGNPVRIKAGTSNIQVNNNTHISFDVANSEAARIDSSSHLLVGTSNNSQSVGDGTKIKEYGAVQVVNDSSTGGGDAFSYYSSAGSNYRFWVNGSGQIAAVYTSITSLSDQRFKENIRDLDDGLSKVMQLQPRKFDWKEGQGKDISNDRGFIAQEFEQVFPDMIEEWKDEAPEGEEPYKAVNANLIPTLVKAIQEQQDLIESLTARIAALEGAN